MHILSLLAFVCLLPSLSSGSPLNDRHELATRVATFNNPVLWEDYPDLDVFRVGDVFYYSSSTFAFSPGAPLLKSYDLVNWTPVSHSVPTASLSSTNCM
jgi:beta-xylosidase